MEPDTPHRRFRPGLFFGLMALPGIISIVTAFAVQFEDVESIIGTLAVTSLVFGSIGGAHYATANPSKPAGLKILIFLVAIAGCVIASFALAIGGCFLMAGLSNL